MDFINKYKNKIILVIGIIAIFFFFRSCSCSKEVVNWAKGCYETDQTNDTNKSVFNSEKDHTIDSLVKVIHDKDSLYNIKIPNSNKGILYGQVKDSGMGYYSTYWYISGQLISRPDGGFYAVDSAIINNKNKELTLYISASPVKELIRNRDSFIYISHIERDTIKDSSYINIKNETITYKNYFVEIYTGLSIPLFDKDGFINFQNPFRKVSLNAEINLNLTSDFSVGISPELIFGINKPEYSIYLQAKYRIYKW